MLPIALAIVRRPVRLVTERVVEPDRVTAGEAAHSRLTITNVGRRATAVRVQAEAEETRCW